MDSAKYIAAFLMIMAGFSEAAFKGCDSGWSYYRGKCYQYVPTRVSMESAFGKCNDKGAHLVKIDNEDENKFLLSLAKRGFSIGLRRDDEGQFRWIDGTKPSYTNWNRGEPNNSGGKEDCTMFYMWSGLNGKWNDARCTSLMAYLCEKDAVLPSDICTCGVRL